MSIVTTRASNIMHVTRTHRWRRKGRPEQDNHNNMKMKKKNCYNKWPYRISTTTSNNTTASLLMISMILFSFLIIPLHLSIAPVLAFEESSIQAPPRQLMRRNTATAIATATSSTSATTTITPITATSSSGSSSGNNPTELIAKANEIPQNHFTHHHHLHPQVPPNYVKLGNNTSSHVVRTLQHHTNNLVQLKATTSTSQSNTSPAANSTNFSETITTSQRKSLPEKICIGTSNRLSGQSNKTDHYQNLVERYRNCTHVIGNLELTWIDREPSSNRPRDLSFLESIREITGYLLIGYVEADKIRLPNLLIIRGREVFKLNSNKEEFAMFVFDSEIQYLEMPNLREIVYGHVGFYNNNNLCSVNTIEWEEILNTGFFPKYSIDSTKTPKCLPCNANCQATSCWGPDEGLCQHFSKTTCPPQCEKGRCYGPGPRDCCHMMCAGGCTGPKQTDCFACKNFNNDGECVPECPPMNKYNPSKFLWEPDPFGRHAYGASCVRECPEHLLRDNGACVRSCPSDKRSQDGECVPCAGPCPKNCQGVDVVNSKNIEQLVNCTEIEGSITILDTSFHGYAELAVNNSMGPRYEPMHPSRLRVLDTVRKITGYLNIQAAHPDFKDLTFLSKLETISGRQTYDMLYSLQIIKTSLVSLNLRSLKRVRSGKILIEENRDLCYADTAQFHKSNVANETDVTIRNNAGERKCRKLGLKCHDQCAPGGCWGPGQNECLACKNYKLEDSCVNDCTSTHLLGILSFDGGNRTCGPCHEECRSGCNGIGAKNCHQCKNFKDGPYCVSECPRHKYNDNGLCQECNKRCVDGCTGPTDRLGLGGCNVCDKFVIESTSNSSIVASCIKVDEPCPRGYYQEYGAEVNDRHPLKAFERKPICKRCHGKCKSCSGYGTHKDVCECAGYMANDQCEDTCPRDFYPDEKTRRCLRCSRECNGCFGPTEADCLNCRVYRMYHDSSSPVVGPIADARISGKTGAATTTTTTILSATATLTPKRHGRSFNCTSRCPPEKPHRVSESNLTDPHCSEDPGPDPGNPKKLPIDLSWWFAFGLIALLGVVSICVLIYRCKIEKEKTVKLTMRLSGFDDVEPLTQSNVKPNLAPLRSIKETELRRGARLGSGFGGTVYMGSWTPEGQEHKDPRPVAIKVLRDNGQSNMNKEFLEEAYIMASVNHTNLVKLLAVCMTPNQLMLVTQLMPLGDLLDYVKKTKHEIGPKNMLEWGKQIARGMAYLEEHRMVHRDLALRNVLLQNSNRAMISDFGLAKFLEVDQSEYHSGGGRLPIKWLAPECIRERKFTHRSDVWAFGVTIWELLTFGEPPFKEYEPKDVPMAIEEGARLRQPSYVTAEVYKVIYSCWFYNPEDRPSFTALARDFVTFARDPERYLSWTTDGLCLGFNSDEDVEPSNEYESDSNSLNQEDEEAVAAHECHNDGEISPRLAAPPLPPPPSLPPPLPVHTQLSARSELSMNQHNRMNEMVGFEMRQHNSDSAAPNGHVTTPTSKKMGMFSNGSSQPLMAEDVFSRSSQQMSSRGSNMTITDPNNNSNFNVNSNNNNSHHHGTNLRTGAERWWSIGHTVSTNSLGNRSEQPTDSDDYLMPSPCSNAEEKFKFYESSNSRVPPRPRQPSSRDPPHSAGLIGISNDAYFITRGTRNYANSNCATNASSGHIPSSLV